MRFCESGSLVERVGWSITYGIRVRSCRIKLLLLLDGNSFLLLFYI